MEKIEIQEEKQLNFRQRVQRVRLELSQSGLKKTGYNNYSKYAYWELGDFTPKIIELCSKYDICTEFHINLTENIAELYLVDCVGDRILKFETLIERMSLKGCNAMQNIQGTHTAAKKILYQQAFEISENDIGEIAKQEEAATDEGNMQIALEEITKINKLINKTNADREAFNKYFKINEVSELTNKQLNRAYHMLEDKLKIIESEKKEIVFGGN